MSNGHKEKLHKLFKRVEKVMREVYAIGEGSLYADERALTITLTDDCGTWTVTYKPKE